MSRRNNAKYKIDRSLGVNLWGRAKSPFNNRPSRPGQHGQANHKLSDYGKQLVAKQRLKKYYGEITEKQFKRYYSEASRMSGDTSVNLVGILERRLDMVVYRMKFVPTIFAARQFVNHYHVTVNGKPVNISSYLVKEGDVIEVKPASKKMALIQEAINSDERNIPDYIEVDHDKLVGKFLKVPLLEEIPYPITMEPSSVVEFYSR